MHHLTDASKLVLGLAVLVAAALVQTVILLALLPSRPARIRSCIVFARIMGVAALWLVDTSAWTVDRTAEVMEQLHRLFAEHLPEDQRPLPA